MKKEISLDYLFKKIVFASAVISGVVLILSAVLLVADVAGRFVLHHSIAGAMEIITMTMVWIAYFSISYTLMEHSHIQMTSFVDKYEGRAKYLNQFVVYFISTVFFVFMAKVGFDVFYSAFIRQEIAQAAIKVYLWIGKLPIFVGSLIMVLQSAAMCVAAAINLKNCRYFQAENTADLKAKEEEKEGE